MSYERSSFQTGKLPKGWHREAVKRLLLDHPRFGGPDDGLAQVVGHTTSACVSLWAAAKQAFPDLGETSPRSFERVDAIQAALATLGEEFGKPIRVAEEAEPAPKDVAPEAKDLAQGSDLPTLMEMFAELEERVAELELSLVDRDPRPANLADRLFTYLDEHGPTTTTDLAEAVNAWRQKVREKLHADPRFRRVSWNDGRREGPRGIVWDLATERVATAEGRRGRFYRLGGKNDG